MAVFGAVEMSSQTSVSIGGVLNTPLSSTQTVSSPEETSSSTMYSASVKNSPTTMEVKVFTKGYTIK